MVDRHVVPGMSPAFPRPSTGPPSDFSVLTHSRMSASTLTLASMGSIRRPDIGPAVVTATLFVVLFSRPITGLALDWWNNPDAGHGLLLAPIILWLAIKGGIRSDAAPSPRLGALILIAAVLLRWLAGLAAELFMMRLSMVAALVGLTIYFLGVRQVVRWWLPLVLLVLTIPIPDVILGSVALPLQFKASELGAAMLEARHVPVLLSGNVIQVPGRELFVTEACSGLRSLTALLALGVLLGGTSLAHPMSRLLLVALAVPVAILINGVRIFATGYAVTFISPEAGTGFMHATEGWLMFVVAFGILAALCLAFRWVEGLRFRRPVQP